jgi:hypothetical protein
MNIVEQYYMSVEGITEAENSKLPSPRFNPQMQQAPSNIGVDEKIPEPIQTTKPLRVELDIDTNIDNTPPIVYGGGGGGGLSMSEPQKETKPKKTWLPLILIVVGGFVIYKGFKKK